MSSRGQATPRRPFDKLRVDPSKVEGRDISARNAAGVGPRRKCKKDDPEPIPEGTVALTAGTQIGSYQIVSALGAGGMGDVYRARDTKLGRDVAIKILPAEFGLDPERLARFEREARLLASLNHANIAAIYGIEDAGDVRALVLELVDGETLAATLSRASLPLPEALAFARQICDALEAAHERGIVHRDLKPANIAVTRDGAVKVLDFGLAKDGAGRAGGSGSDLTHSPTMMAPTMHGVLLGTAPYMSPEQARGKTVDKRTDIWAFGCVLYEMLTGRRAFPGETMSDAVAAILEREPDWSALPGTTPASVRRLLARCLTKDPKRRLRDIGDARFDLDESSADVTPAVVSGVRPLPAGLLVVTFIALAVAAFAAWRLLGAAVAVAPRNVTLQRMTDFVGNEESPAISPDGKTVAFVAPLDGTRQIWVRLLAGGTPLQLTRDPVDHQQPRWAPDSSSLVYYSPSPTPGQQGTIWEVSALGGPPLKLTSALSGGDVSHDGRYVVTFRVDHGQLELAAVGRAGAETKRLVAPPASDDFAYDRPRWAPNDLSVAFQRTDTGGFDKRVYILSLGSGALNAVAQSDDLNGFTWLPDGSGVVYSSSSGSTVLYPPAFNLRTVSRDGTGDRQLTFGDVSYIEPDADRLGRLAGTRVRLQSDIWKIPVTGNPDENTRAAVRVTRQTGQVQTPSVSPDGTELVYLSDSGGHGNLWIAQTDGTNMRQITHERDPAVSIGVPAWAPEGGQIVFIMTHAGSPEQWLIAPDGSGLRQLLSRGTWAYWSGDGRWLYTMSMRDRTFCVVKTPVDGGQTVPVRCDAAAPAASPDGSAFFFSKPLRTAFGVVDWELHRAQMETGPSQPIARIAGSRVPVEWLNFHAIVSPDGRWLAFPLVDRGTSNIWLQPAEGGAMRAATDFGQRSTVIARRISWSPDGKFIYAAVAETDADVVLLDGLLR
jgi:Tol biopolymer transport system component